MATLGMLDLDDPRDKFMANGSEEITDGRRKHVDRTLAKLANHPHHPDTPT
jgi:hypothetical protein